MVTNFKLKFSFLILVLITKPLWANPIANMQVIGLFKNQAIVVINGQQQKLKVGDTTSTGLTLIAADSSKAIFSYQQQKITYHLSKQINSTYTNNQTTILPAPAEPIQIPYNKDGNYLTTLKINGKTVTAIIDTGASAITLNKNQAQQLKLNYRQGKNTIVNTAGGKINGFAIILAEVTLGNITEKAVDAIVLDGEEPYTVLLGMSFLTRVTMKFDETTKNLEISNLSKPSTKLP